MRFRKLLPEDRQDAQRLMVGSIGAFLFFYGMRGGDVDALIGRIQQAGSGAVIIWAVVLEPPPIKR